MAKHVGLDNTAFNIFLGGPSHRRLVQDYERIMDMLNFRFDTAISKSAMAG